MGMALVTWVNIARFAGDETQDWLRAFLFAGPVLFIPLALKWADDQRGLHRWTSFRCIVAAIFICSVVAFDLSFTYRFGSSPTTEDIVRGTIGHGGWGSRILLLSQLLVDPVLSLVAFFMLRESLVAGSTEVPNPDHQARAVEAAELETKMREAAVQLAQYTGLLKQCECAKEAFADKCEARWRGYEQARESAEQDQREEEKDWDARQARRQQREKERQRLLGSWNNTLGGNGQVSQNNHR